MIHGIPLVLGLGTRMSHPYVYVVFRATILGFGVCGCVFGYDVYDIVRMFMTESRKNYLGLQITHLYSALIRGANLDPNSRAHIVRTLTKRRSKLWKQPYVHLLVGHPFVDRRACCG